ncbi:hypothetical protein [Nonomuraea sp. NPDC049028]
MRDLIDLPEGWEWSAYGGSFICPDGHEIEMDGTCPDGDASPLLRMGLI